MSKLEKILNLVKKTGDKYIIADEKGEPQAVIMDFNEYELLTTNFGDFEANFSDFPEEKNEYKQSALTEKEMLAKINRELNEWHEKQEAEKVNELEEELNGPKDRFSEEDDRYYLEPID